MASELPSSDKLSFKITHHGRQTFVMQDCRVNLDIMTKPPQSVQHIALCPGAAIYLADMHNDLKNEYKFEIESPQCNISFCTAGRSSTSFSTGIIPSSEVIQCPSTCTFSYLDSARGTWKPGGKSCSLATLNISPHVFSKVWQEFADVLPQELKPLAKGENPKQFYVGLPISPSLQLVINSLLHSPISGPGQQLLHECKVIELLVHLATLLSNRKQLNDWLIPLSSGDLERIHAARTLLEQRMENPPTLSELSRTTGLNEFKLKRGFRQVFGTTPLRTSAYAATRTGAKIPGNGRDERIRGLHGRRLFEPQQLHRPVQKKNSAPPQARCCNAPCVQAIANCRLVDRSARKTQEAPPNPRPKPTLFIWYNRRHNFSASNN